MPCDNWLGLKNYKSAEFKTKTAWLNEQLNALLHANKQALKGIHKSTKHNRDRTVARIYLFLLGIMYCCATIRRGAIRSRIDTSQMFILLLAIIRKSQMFITFSC